jgi:TP901 family phage tail tape measure protein
MASSDVVLNIVTRGAQLAKQQLNTLGNASKGSAGKLAQLGKFAKIAGVAIGVALAKGLSVAVGEYIKFNDKMVQSLAIMQTSVSEQKAMAQTARDVASVTAVSAEQSAEAYFFLASAGLNAQQSIAALPQVAKFAQAGMFDMATATDLATDAQSALGLTVSDAGENLANLSRVTDVLVKANTLANASVQQFSEALTTKSGAALKVVNKDIEEGVAVLAAFADRGVKGAEAGDKLNQVLRDIPRATAKNKNEFAALGLEMFDAEGNMRNVADIIEELDSVLGPMSDEMKAATLDQLGLNRGVADAVKILSGAGDQIRNYEKALRDSAGVTEEVADNQLESLKAQLGLAKDKFIDLGLAIIEEYEPAMLDAIKSTNAFLDVLSGRAPDDIKDLLRGFDGLFKVLSYLNPAFKRGTGFVEAYEEAQANIKRANFGKSYFDIDQALHDFNITQTDARRNAERLEVEWALSKTTVDGLTESIEELDEAEEALNKERKEKALPTLSRVINAMQAIKDINESIADLETARNKILTKKIEAETKVTKAEEKVLEAETALNKQKEISKKVTLEEEIAILRQEEAVRKLTEQEDRNTLQEKELELAKRKLEEIRLASTSATREEIRAQQDLERAQDDVLKAEEALKQATLELAEAQRELNEATADTPQNLMEMALAKKELDDALAEQKDLKSFTTAIQQMVELGLGSFDDLVKGYYATLNAIRGGTSGTPPITPSSVATSETFNEDGSVDPSKVSSPVGRGIGTMDSSGVITNTNNSIVVNVGGALSSSNEISDAVANAMIQAQKRGIKVLI